MRQLYWCHASAMKMFSSYCDLAHSLYMEPVLRSIVVANVWFLKSAYTCVMSSAWMVQDFATQRPLVGMHKLVFGAGEHSSSGPTRKRDVAMCRFNSTVSDIREIYICLTSTSSWGNLAVVSAVWYSVMSCLQLHAAVQRELFSKAHLVYKSFQKVSGAADQVQGGLSLRCVCAIHAEFQDSCQMRP